MILSIPVLLVLVGCMFFGLVLMLAYLAIRKELENRHAKRLEAAVQLLSPKVSNYLLTGAETRHLSVQGSDYRLLAVEQLLEQYAVLLSDEPSRQRIRSFAAKHLAGYYKTCLNSRSTAVRMNALFRVERFDLRELETDLLRLLQHTGKRGLPELIRIYSILAAWDSLPFIEALPAYVNGKSFSEFQRRQLLSRLETKWFLYYLSSDKAAKLDSEWLYNFVDMAGIGRRDACASVLAHMLGYNNQELRVRALKALCELSVPEFDERLAIHAASESWQERMMAAKLYGKLRHPSLVPLLIDLLSDPSWHVRTQAAQSLLNYAEGSDLLAEAAAASEDPYARDIANQWLERGRS